MSDSESSRSSRSGSAGEFIFVKQSSISSLYQTEIFQKVRLVSFKNFSIFFAARKRFSLYLVDSGRIENYRLRRIGMFKIEAKTAKYGFSFGEFRRKSFRSFEIFALLVPKNFRPNICGKRFI